MSTSVGQVVAVDNLPARALRQREIVADLGVRQDDHVVPAQPALSPAGVRLDEFAQRITGVAGLADRIDLVFAAAAPLPPRVAVVPDVAALDLKTDDAGALDRDDEVDLVVLEVVGHPLAGNHPVVDRQLFAAVPDRPNARRRWPTEADHHWRVSSGPPRRDTVSRSGLPRNVHHPIEQRGRIMAPIGHRQNSTGHRNAVGSSTCQHRGPNAGAAGVGPARDNGRAVYLR